MPHQDIRRFGAAIQNQIQSGQVGQELPPQLRVNGRDISEEAKFNTFLLEERLSGLVCDTNNINWLGVIC